MPVTLFSYIILLFSYLSRAFCTFSHFVLTKEIINIFPFMKYTFLVCKQNVGAGMSTLISIPVGLVPSIFLSTDRKSASYEGKNGWKGWLFPARVDFFDFDVMIYKVLFPICTFDLVCKQFCFPPRKGYKQEKRKYENRSVINVVVLMIILSIVDFLRCIV